MEKTGRQKTCASNKSLKDYIKAEILPLYDSFDAAPHITFRNGDNRLQTTASRVVNVRKTHNYGH